jgi:hypothetical protein
VSRDFDTPTIRATPPFPKTAVARSTSSRDLNSSWAVDFEVARRAMDVIVSPNRIGSPTDLPHFPHVWSGITLSIDTISEAEGWNHQERTRRDR